MPNETPGPEQLQAELERLRRENQELRQRLAGREPQGRLLDDTALRLVLDQVPMTVFISDGERVHYANQAAARMWGVPGPADLEGRTIAELATPAVAEFIAERLAFLREEPGPLPIKEHKIVRPDGRELWVQSTALPVDLPQGRLFCSMVSDITERKRQELERKEIDEHYRLLEEYVGDVVWRTDADLAPVYFSPSVERMLGYTPAEMLAMDRADYIAPGSVEVVRAALEKRRQREGADQGDDATRMWQLQYTTKTGRLIWVESHTAALRDPEGRFSGLVGVMREVTPRVKAQQELRDNRELLAGIFEHSATALFVLDVDPDDGGFFIVDMNPYLLEQMGLPRAGWRGKSFEELGPLAGEEAMAALQGMFARCAWENRALTEELRLLLGGRETWWIVSLTPVADEAGRVARIIGAAADITTGKLTELELAEAKRHLEDTQRVAHMGEWRWEAEGNQVVWSPTMYEVFGLEPGPLPAPERIMEMIHPEDGHLLQAFMQEMLASDSLVPFHFRVVWPDGEVHWVWGQGICRRDGDGRPLTCRGHVQDVTELERAKQAEEASRRRYQTLVENAQDAIYVIQDGVIRYLNPSASRLGGYSAADLLDRHFTDFLAPQDRERILQRYHSRLEGNPEPTNYSLRFVGAQGQDLWLQVNPVMVEWEGRPATLNIARDITELKQAEQDLALSRERYRKLFAASPVWVSVTTVDEGRYLEVNHAFTQVTGFTAQETVGRTSVDLGLFASMDDRDRAVRELRRTGRLDQVPVTFKVKDGSLREFNWSAEAVEVDGQQCSYNVLVDVTDRRQAQKELKASEQRFRAMFANMSSGVVINQPDGRGDFVVTGFNPAAERITGASREDVLGRSPREVLPGFADEEMLSSLKRVWASGRPERLGPRFFRDGRSSGWLEHYHYRLPSGEVVSIFDDVTQRITAQRSIQESEQKFRTLAENSRDYIMRYDRSGRHLYMNRAGLEVAGLEPGQIIGKTHHQAGFPRDLCQMWEAAIGRVFATGQPTGEVFRWESAKGEVVLDLQLSPEPGPDGRVHTVLGVSRDITEMALAQEERRRLEAQLRQSQKIEALGTLAGGIAHDFNNILAAIMGYAEMASEGLPLGSPAAEDLANIMTSAQRGKGVVSQILGFTRQAAHKRQPLHLGRAVDEALGMLRATIPAYVELKLHEEMGLGPVLAEPNQIHQLVVNICSNAAQAIGEAPGRIELELSRLELDAGRADGLGLRPGPYQRLSIRDTGPGMDADTAERIFEPFFTTKEVGKGTGMGLAVVHGIVTGHGGTVRVETAPGRGSTFHVFLPEAADAAEASSEDQPVDVQPGTGRIIFVDDEASLANLGRRQLERLGYRVEAFTSSQEAWRRFQEAPDEFDLLVTDQAMPGMTGQELAGRALDLRPGLAVIICSGHVDEVDEETGRILGVQGYLHKPLSLGELSQAVREALAGLDEDQPG